MLLVAEMFAAVWRVTVGTSYVPGKIF